MARGAMVGLVLVVAALLQVSVLPIVAVSGFVPDLLLLLVLAFAIEDGRLTAVRVAFPAGMLLDLLSTNVPLGLSALVYLGIAFAVAAARPHLSPESISAPILLIAAGTFMGVGGYGVLSALLARQSATLELITEASLVATLYAVLLAPAALAVVRGIDRAFPLDLSSTASAS
jgi:rod shape-determining protein MreD